MDRVLNAGLNNPLVVAFLFGMTTGISLYTIAKEILGNSSVSSSSSSSSVSELSLLQTKLESEFALPRDTLHRITRQMINELKRGLESDGATLKQIPSFVTRLPTGQESGSFLALDLGGSNFRVCEVLLKETLSNGGGENTATTSVGHVPSPVLVAGALPVSAGVRVRQRKFTISDALKTG